MKKTAMMWIMAAILGMAAMATPALSEAWWGGPYGGYPYYGGYYPYYGNYYGYPGWGGGYPYYGYSYPGWGGYPYYGYPGGWGNNGWNRWLPWNWW